METTVSLAPKPCSFYYPMASFPAPSQPLLIPLPHPAPTWARRCEALGGESRGEAFPFQDTRMDIWPLDSATILCQGHLQGPRHAATSTTASLKQMCSLLRGDVEAGSSGFVVCSETILLLPPVMELSQEPDYIPLLLKTVLSLWDNPTSLPCAFCPCQLTSLQRHFSSLPSDWTKLFVVPQTHSTLRHL